MTATPLTPVDHAPPSGREWSVLRSTPDWDAMAGPGWADRIMTVDVADRFHAKQGRSIARWTLTRDGRELVVYLKRHYVLPRWHGLLATLIPRVAWSPGLAEWEHLAWAREHGLPVPRAVAVGQSVGSWARLRSFVAVEELRDMLPLHEAIPRAFEQLTTAEFARWKRGLIAELARLSRELHRRRVFHQDLYLCHFYVAAADTERVPGAWPGRVVMIDFHRLAQHRVGWAWWQAKDLGQLLFSTHGVAGVTDRDRQRFWKSYLEGDWGAAVKPGRGVRALIRLRAWNNDRHNARRTARFAG